MGDLLQDVPNAKYIEAKDVERTIALSSVEYKKLAEGYELNVVRGWVGTPELNYDANFWQGLGLKKSNVQKCKEKCRE